MKVKVGMGWRGPCVTLTQGNQSFTLDYSGTEKDCRWYAKMFRKALQSHDAEQEARRCKHPWPPRGEGQ